jgi:hypothetical protein
VCYSFVSGNVKFSDVTFLLSDRTRKLYAERQDNISGCFRRNRGSWPSLIDFPSRNNLGQFSSYKLSVSYVCPDFALTCLYCLSCVIAHHIEATSYVSGRTAEKKTTFKPFYGARSLIVVFTTIRHWCVSWARWIQSTPFHIINKSIPKALHTQLCLTFTILPFKQNRLLHRRSFFFVEYRTKIKFVWPYQSDG